MADRLAALRAPDESYSNVILKLVESGGASTAEMD